MSRKPWRVFAGLGAIAMSLLPHSNAKAQAPAGPPPLSPYTVDQLVRMDPEMLNQIYQQASAPAVPVGKVRGRAIVFPGSAIAAPSSRVAQVIWQGKVFSACGTSVVNKFFGVRAVKGEVYQAESWMDGRPALIIDYSKTSRVYRPYRDEIREVAPGLFLGLMYSRTCPQPTLKTYFLLEVPTCP